MKDKKKTTPLTWIVSVVVFVLCFYISYCLFSGIIPFQSKSSKCKIEAQDRATSLRDATLESLELKENPTEEDLERIEELKRKQVTNLVSRDDYDYFYEDCMK
ncbi:MAG: hypothetical protein PHP08_02950 [Candidatus Dojkabacteria bacterium]|nr:hypothetical protein [Candidatus Dojkabacteria bacterium]